MSTGHYPTLVTRCPSHQGPTPKVVLRVSPHAQIAITDMNENPTNTSNRRAHMLLTSWAKRWSFNSLLARNRKDPLANLMLVGVR